MHLFTPAISALLLAALTTSTVAALEQLSSPSWALPRISSRRPGTTTYHYPASAGAGIPIYILGTGIAPTPAELPRVRFGPDFTKGPVSGSGSDFPPSDYDDNGHSTYLATIAAGVVYGVAKSAQLVSVKILDARGIGTLENMVRGINWVREDVLAKSPATPNRPKDTMASKPVRGIALLTSGSGLASSLNTTELDMAITRARDAGVLLVAPAGGQGTDACKFVPAHANVADVQRRRVAPTILVVGATDENDRVAGFSNRGPCVGMYAPGVRVPGMDNMEKVRTWSSTGAAAALVAGIAALYLAEHAGGQTVFVNDLTSGIIEQATQGVIKDLDATEDHNVLAYNGGAGDE